MRRKEMKNEARINRTRLHNYTFSSGFAAGNIISSLLEHEYHANRDFNDDPAENAATFQGCIGIKLPPFILSALSIPMTSRFE